MPQERYRVQSTAKRPSPAQVQKKAPQRAAKGSASPSRAARLNREKAQREAERRRLQAKQRAKLRRQRRRVLFRLSGILALVFTLLYWGIVAVRIASRPTVGKDAMDIQVFRQGEKKADFTYEAKEVVRGSTSYLPVSFLEKYFPITLFGDEKSQSFMITSTGEYATFSIGTCNVLINGQNAANSDSALLEDGVLLIPVDFFTEKMNCFAFSYSSAKECNVLSINEDIAPAFLFKSAVPSAGVARDSIPTPPAPEPAAE